MRKYLWAVDLVVVTLCSILLARAASSAVESRYFLNTPSFRPAVRMARAATEPVYAKQVEEILKRNVFCSTCPPIIPGPDKADAGAPVDRPPEKTSMPLTLMAIMYSPPPLGLKWSVAVVRDTESKTMGPYAVGSKIRSATVTEIEETRIYFDNGGKTEFLDLLDSQPPAASGVSPQAAPVAAAVQPVDPLTAEMDRGIKKTGENTFDITRATLEAVLGNMNLLSRSARIVPEIRDGKAAGFRLYSVRPDGPFAKIGMQNGDVILAINGLEITSPEKALEVYSKLKSASHLSVGLERNGGKVTKDYSIR